MSVETIGSRIRELRKDLHLTQKQFAEKIGITQAHLSGVESDKDNPSDSVLRIICNEFNIGGRWLKLGEGEKAQPFMSKEKFIAMLPIEDRPLPSESDLLFILNHQIPKVKDEFLNLTVLYRNIVTTCETPCGFDFLAIQTLALILRAVWSCFDNCSNQVRLLPDEIAEDELFTYMGKVAHEVMDCKHDIIESLDSYQVEMRDRGASRINI